MFNNFLKHVSWRMSTVSWCFLFFFSYSGDLWSGSEAGVIKIWPWEAIERSFSLTAEERPMAAMLIERSFIDPSSQVAVNGYSNTLNSDVKYLLSDNTRAKVWSAGYLSFAFWYAYILNIIFCYFQYVLFCAFFWVKSYFPWIQIWSPFDLNLYVIISVIVNSIFYILPSVCRQHAICISAKGKDCWCFFLNYIYVLCDSLYQPKEIRKRKKN